MRPRAAPTSLDRARGLRRVAAILGLYLAAPVCAEFVQGYLPITGDPLGLLGALLVLAPLYGGAALLIREAAVRTGRGWPGVLLLAAAFGVAQAGVIDLSLVLGPQTGVAVFDGISAVTVVAGVSAAAATTWIAGHVIMSIGTPLALVDWAAPGLRGRPWLGPFGSGLTALLFAGAALLVHVDQRGEAALPWYRPASAAAFAAVLAGLAFTSLGRPLSRRTTRGAPSVIWLLLLAFAAKLAFDLLPPSWLGVATAWTLLAGAAASVVHAARAPAGSPRHGAALAAGALLAWTVVGFLAPDLPGVTPLHRYLHNAAFTAVACAVAVAVVRAPASRDAPNEDR